jgi:hypothetical protein
MLFTCRVLLAVLCLLVLALHRAASPTATFRRGLHLALLLLWAAVISGLRC